MDNLNTFKERIKELCREYGISQKFLCDKIGRAKTYLNDVWNGKTSIKDEDLETIADILHTNSAYLRGETDNPAPVRTEPIKISTSPTKQELIDAINAMSDEQAEFFLKLIKQVKNI